MSRKNGKGDGVAPAPLPSAMLIVFAYGNVLPETVKCIVQQAKAWPDLGIETRHEDALIPRMRDRAASWFLEWTEAEVLIMLDHDIEWEPGDMEYIAQRCAETKGVVAGIYPKRGMGQDPPVTPALDAPEGRYHFGDDVLLPALHVPTGFLAIHRDVLLGLAKRLPYTMSGCWPFFLIGLFPGQMPDDHDECPFCMPAEDGKFVHYEYLSEDYAFVRRVHEVGFPVYMALKPRLKHVGHYVYRMVDAITQPEPDRPVPVTIGGPASVQIEVLHSLSSHAAEFFGIPLDRYAQACQQARANLAELWTEAKVETPAEEMAWYKRVDVGRRYVLDLADWHQRGVTANQIHEIEEFLPALNGPVLDYGAGIGSLALHLTRKGADVTCYEPNAELRRFMKFRAEKMGVEVKIKGTAPDGKYALIICWHVLEHVSDPESLMIDLERMLLPGGRILSQSDFHVDPLHTMHHQREDNGDGLFEAVGLTRLGPNMWARVSEVPEAERWQSPSLSSS